MEELIGQNEGGRMLGNALEQCALVCVTDLTVDDANCW